MAMFCCNVTLKAFLIKYIGRLDAYKYPRYFLILRLMSDRTNYFPFFVTFYCKKRIMSTDEIDIVAQKYPLVYKHSRNYAAKIIQKAWNKYMARITYKYLLQCCRDFEQTLSPKELSRIYPEFLESSDSKIKTKLQIKMQGVSFPPCLVCRIISDQTPSVDGKKHSPKWIPLFNAGNSSNAVDQKSLVRLYLEAQHLHDEAIGTRPPRYQ